MSGVGVILRMLREPPAVRGPLFRKLAIAHVIMAAVLIPFWDMGGLDIPSSVGRKATIVDDPVQDKDQFNFYEVLFAVDGNPEGRYSRAYIRQDAVNLPILTKGRQVILLCNDVPCRVAEIRLNGQTLVSRWDLTQIVLIRNTRTGALILVSLAFALVYALTSWQARRACAREQAATQENGAAAPITPSPNHPSPPAESAHATRCARQ